MSVRSLVSALHEHWPEYLIEAAALGTFMISACLFTVIAQHPDSPVRAMLESAWQRRLLVGLAMGATAVTIVYSRWGKRSGAHMNPAFTLTFLRLGRVAPADAVWYIAAQFVGGIGGVLAARAILGRTVAHPAINYVVTAPGEHGAAIAFVAEVVITCILMVVVLWSAASERWQRLTGVFVGILLVLFIVFEDPYSGMSLNPARSFGPAAIAGSWGSLWVYFVAPPLGMALAAQLFLALRSGPAPCAKLRHVHDRPCHFCAYHRSDAVAAPDDTHIGRTGARAGTIPETTSF